MVVAGLTLVQGCTGSPISHGVLNAQVEAPLATGQPEDDETSSASQVVPELQHHSIEVQCHALTHIGCLHSHSLPAEVSATLLDEEDEQDEAHDEASIPTTPQGASAETCPTAGQDATARAPRRTTGHNSDCACTLNALLSRFWCNSVAALYSAGTTWATMQAEWLIWVVDGAFWTPAVVLQSRERWWLSSGHRALVSQPFWIFSQADKCHLRNMVRYWWEDPVGRSQLRKSVHWRGHSHPDFVIGCGASWCSVWLRGWERLTSASSVHCGGIPQFLCDLTWCTF